MADILGMISGFTSLTAAITDLAAAIRETAATEQTGANIRSGSLTDAVSALALSVTVDPTPVTVQVDQTPVNITVDPTPVTVQVDPASVTIDNAGLVAKLDDLRTMLETRSVAETVAGNTRNADIVEILGG